MPSSVFCVARGLVSPSIREPIGEKNRMLIQTSQMMMTGEGLDKLFNDAVIKCVNGPSLYEIVLSVSAKLQMTSIPVLL